LLDQVEEGKRQLIAVRRRLDGGQGAEAARRTRAWATLLLLLAGLGLACAPGERAVPEPHLIPIDLPELEAQVFGSGPLRVVNFWATWCPPCVAELPDLVALAKEGAPAGGGAEGYQVIGISLDLAVPGGQASIEPKVRDFLRSRGIFYENYLYTGSLPDLLERFDLPGSIPYTMIVSPTGEVRWRHEGQTTHDRLAAALAALPAAAGEAAP
jgi:thiol-disulfide isomerase/thioredoxin